MGVVCVHGGKVVYLIQIAPRSSSPVVLFRKWRRDPRIPYSTISPLLSAVRLGVAVLSFL